MKQDRKPRAADLAAVAVDVTGDHAESHVGKTQHCKAFTWNNGSYHIPSNSGNRCLRQVRTAVCYPQ